MIRVVHLSDLHVTEGHRLADQGELLRWLVADARALGRVDAWLVTGDLYGRTVPHRPTPAEREVLEPVLVDMANTAPVIVIVGNHDHEQAIKRAEDLAGIFPIYVISAAQVVTVHTPDGVLDVFGLAFPTKRFIVGEDARGVDATTRAVEEALGSLLAVWSGTVRKARDAGRAVIFAGHFQVAGGLASGGEVLAPNEVQLAAGQLAALPVNYGALGHLHRRQEVTAGWWYVGSPWRCDFGEREAKCYHVVELPLFGPAHVEARWTPCRDMITLEWRWAADHEDGEPRWVIAPDDAKIAACAGAEVKARLVVPDQWAAGCPFDGELERLVAAGAWRVAVERAVEPTLRIRAPAVAAAPDLADKMAAFWGTLATTPDPTEQTAAREALHELRTFDDERVAGFNGELIDAGAP